MNAKDLKKGDAVLITTHLGRVIEATFIENSGCSCYFDVPEYAGLDGPEDTGRCAIPNKSVRHRVTRNLQPCLKPV